MTGSAFVDCATQAAVSAAGRSFAYRRLGPRGGTPLLLLQHFRGSMDNWDPALIDALASRRDIIVFDNVGVGSSDGVTPDTIAQMARDAIGFIAALGAECVDLLGYSIGSSVAQEVALIRPSIARRVVLASAAPQGAAGMHGWAPDIIAAVGAKNAGAKDLLYAFFKDTPSSQAAGAASLQRIFARSVGRDPQTSWETRNAQYDAVLDWGIPNHAMLARVGAITQPAFIANGDEDRMILPRYSHLLAGLLPDAKLKIYPDAAHGFLFQHHAEFGADVHGFLDS